MTSCTESDRQYFEQAIAAELDGLYGAALRLTRNRADAEDVVAEAVTKAWAGFAALQDRQCFRAWIYRILTNTYYSNCRKHTEASLEALAEGSDDEAPFSLFENLHQPFLLWWGNPEQEFLNKVLREHLAQALDAIPDSFRVVVMLAELEGFSYPEIAQILDVPVGTVRSRLSRGRSLLQKQLWQYAHEAGLVQGTGTTQAQPTTLGTAEADDRHDTT